jgi:sulfate permease, SulP family
MPRLPAALVVVVAAIGLSWALDLQADGVAIVGAIPAGLPSFDVPTPAFQDVVHLVRRQPASSSSRSPTRS